MTAFDTAWALLKMPYHGTDRYSAEEILQSGLNVYPGTIIYDGKKEDGDFSFASEAGWEAADYAEEMAELGDGEGIVLHISDDFKPYVRVGQHYIYDKIIPPEYIRAVYSTTRGDLE